MVYESKKNLGVKAKLLSEDTKCKTVILEYITGDKVCSTFSISQSTLKRWWKKVEEVEEEVVETIEEVVEEKQVQEMPEAVEELIKDVDEEVEKACEELHIDSKTLKPKKEKKVKKEKSVPMYSVNDFIPLARNPYKIYDTMPNCINLKTENGKGLAEIRVGKNKVTVFFKEALIEDMKKLGFTCRNGRKYFLPTDIQLDYTSNTIEDVKKILDVIYK